MVPETGPKKCALAFSIHPVQSGQTAIRAWRVGQRIGLQLRNAMHPRVPQSPPNYRDNRHFSRVKSCVCNVRRLQPVRLLTEGLCRVLPEEPNRISPVGDLLCISPSSGPWPWLPRCRPQRFSHRCLLPRRQFPALRGHIKHVDGFMRLGVDQNHLDVGAVRRDRGGQVVE